MMTQRYRRLQVEGLEQRQLMAGDVTVTLGVGRILTIAGDGGDNGVLVTTEGNNVQVVGLEHGGSATTINGNYRASFKNVRQVSVTFGPGDDALAVTNLNLAGGLDVQMGDGDDLVGLGNFDNIRTEEILGITLSSPWIDEHIDSLIGALNVKGDASVDLGDGENELRGRATTVGKNLSITGGIDRDIIRLEGSGTRRQPGFIAGLRTGLDTTIVTGAGHDLVTLTDYTSRDLSISVGAGNDDLHITRLVGVRDVEIDGGIDRDQLHVTDAPIRKLRLFAGAGDDDIYLKNTVVKLTSLNDGGTGDNIYHDLGGNTPGPIKLRRLNYRTVATS